jgi:prevent-host-death family protein
MITVGAFEAKAKIAELLDRVAAGETVLITRRGVAAAVMSPPDRLRRDKTKRLDEVRRFRAGCATGKVDIEALIDEGRA